MWQDYKVLKIKWDYESKWQTKQCSTPARVFGWKNVGVMLSRQPYRHSDPAGCFWKLKLIWWNDEHWLHDKGDIDQMPYHNLTKNKTKLMAWAKLKQKSLWQECRVFTMGPLGTMPGILVSVHLKYNNVCHENTGQKQFEF